jgi:hypothetical protein
VRPGRNKCSYLIYVFVYEKEASKARACMSAALFMGSLWCWFLACGLYYKSFMIIIYDCNDSTIVESLL